MKEQITEMIEDKVTEMSRSLIDLLLIKEIINEEIITDLIEEIQR